MDNYATLRDAPRKTIKLKCKRCEEKFRSKYAHQKFCRNPCTPNMWNNEHRIKKERVTRANEIKKRDELIDLNNKYLGVKL
jgi:hypothetical protein